MAAKVLDDILNNYLPVECLLEWLSNKVNTKEDDVFLRQYECSQIEFVSYFLIFLREQSSRDFQVYDAETPRKNSHSRVIKNTPTDLHSSPQLKFHNNSSLSVNNLDLESLQSFPTLSSCSSKAENSEKRLSECTPCDSLQDDSNKDIEKRSRRVKLFSETVEGNSKTSKKELEFLDDVDLKFVNENKFTISTPKATLNSTLPTIDCFNTSDLQADISPKFGSKPKWKNHTLELSSPEINHLPFKSKSFTCDSTNKSKDNKTNCRMSLGDFILNDMNDSKKDKKSKSKKRVSVTRVSSQSHINNCNPIFNEKTDEGVDSRLNVINDEHISQVDFEKKIESVLDKVEEDMDKDIRLFNTTSNSVEAKLELVTWTEELQILSQIYSFLIEENYCQNVMIELCFIISLLVIQDHDKKVLDFDLGLRDLSLHVLEKKFFGSIHNCVYFAVETLWLQRNLLLLLNLSAIKLLSENPRIEKFNVKLKEFLVSACAQKQTGDEMKRHIGLMKTGMQGNVSFQYETDNRENFTSDFSFHSFRKQRDLFYNILAIWEANHLTTGWLFSVGLGSKIRSLLSISSDPINLLHLSRLFRNQLIMSCCGENQTEEDFNEEILQLLPSADPNKILRLKARLTSSPKRQGPCPLPDFTGHQEFYKDFLLCTSHSTFHEHLKNSLCDEILRLNETELTGDMEDDDSSLDEQTQERYFQCTNILRLLAKFLGFVEFMPYRGEKPFSDRILNIHCSVRNNTLPLFDLVSCLKSAISKQKLTLTIPWTVSYLSMIDPYSAHLKAFQNVWRLLIIIYKHLKTFKNVRSRFYLKLTLGWIFQLPAFPADQFFTVLEDFNKNFTEPLMSDTKTGLDSYDFIEDTLLYSLCPYLNEINVILSDNSGCSVRHIRPVTTQRNSVTKSQTSKQLELRLEGNFLHNQSSSTRKTVEFVTERIASIVIKHLIHNVIPKIKKAAGEELENFSPIDLKEAEAKSEVLSEKCFTELLTVCEKENWEISSKRSEIALKALLSNDLQGSVANTCAKIVTRQATEKVQRWMQSHVTLSMVKKEFSSLAKKCVKKLPDLNTSGLDSSDITLNKSLSSKGWHHLPPEGRGVVHKEEAWPPSRALKEIREVIWTVLEGGSSAQEVASVIDETIKTIRHRNDLIPAAEKALALLVLDLVVVFCVHSRDDDFALREIFQKFFQLLRCVESEHFSQDNLERVVCSRNVTMILNEGSRRDRAWENLGNFLVCLMDENLLTKEQVETQLVSLLRQNWEKEDGVQLAKFISVILSQYSQKNGCDKFSLLLEYIVDTLNDDEPKSESLG